MAGRSFLPPYNQAVEFFVPPPDAKRPTFGEVPFGTSLQVRSLVVKVNFHTHSLPEVKSSRVAFDC